MDWRISGHCACGLVPIYDCRQHRTKSAYRFIRSHGGSRLWSDTQPFGTTKKCSRRARLVRTGRGAIVSGCRRHYLASSSNGRCNRHCADARNEDSSPSRRRDSPYCCNWRRLNTPFGIFLCVNPCWTWSSSTSCSSPCCQQHCSTETLSRILVLARKL